MNDKRNVFRVRMAKAIIRKEIHDAAGDFRVRGVRFSKRKPFGVGSAGFDFLGGRCFDVAVGIKSLPKSVLSESDFVKLLCTGLHEAAHVKQYAKGFLGKDDIRITNALFTVGHNPSHYDLGRNYITNFSELNAELSAIGNVHEILSANFPDMDADKALLNYVNRRIDEFRASDARAEAKARESGREYHSEEHKYYFFDDPRPVPRHYGSFDEFLESAAATMEKVAHVARPYPEWMLGYRDEFLDVAYRGGPKWRPFFEAFQAEPDPARQDMMLASVHAWLHPREASCFACARDGRLDPVAVFGREFPEDPGTARRRTRDRVYRRPRMDAGRSAPVRENEGATERLLAEAERIAGRANDGRDFHATL